MLISDIRLDDVDLFWHRHARILGISFFTSQTQENGQDQERE